MIDPKKKDEYIKALGQIAVSMVYLEKTIGSAISELISFDYEVGERIVAGENFQSLERLIQVLFRYRITDLEQLKKFDALCGELEKANTNRNTYLHSYWLLHEIHKETGLLRTKTSKQRPKEFDNNIYHTSLERLIAVAEHMDKTRERLVQLMNSNQLTIRNSIVKEHNKVSL